MTNQPIYITRTPTGGLRFDNREMELSPKQTKVLSAVILRDDWKYATIHSDGVLFTSEK